MTNEALVASLKDSGAIRSKAVESAFRAVDRARFVPEESRGLAYLDTALPIGEGQTISQPTVVAYCLEWLSAEPGNCVLDVGSGSGYTTALLAHMVGLEGGVLGLERIPALVKMGAENLAGFHFPHARIERAGEKLGRPEEGPYDRILVSTAAEEIPQTFKEQLRNGGRLVIAVRSAICVVDRRGNDFNTVCHEGFVFVPLIT